MKQSISHHQKRAILSRLLHKIQHTVFWIIRLPKCKKETKIILLQKNLVSGLYCIKPLLMLILLLIDIIESVIAYDNSSEDENIQEFNYLGTLRVNKQGTNK